MGLHLGHAHDRVRLELPKDKTKGKDDPIVGFDPDHWKMEG